MTANSFVFWCRQRYLIELISAVDLDYSFIAQFDKSQWYLAFMQFVEQILHFIVWTQFWCLQKIECLCIYAQINHNRNEPYHEYLSRVLWSCSGYMSSCPIWSWYSSNPFLGHYRLSSCSQYLKKMGKMGNSKLKLYVVIITLNFLSVYVVLLDGVYDGKAEFSLCEVFTEYLWVSCTLNAKEKSKPHWFNSITILCCCFTFGQIRLQ